MKTKLQILVAGVLLATAGTGLGQPCITINTQPQNQTPCVGTTATFTVGATGAEPLSYQWQESFDGTTFADRLNSTNTTLQITNVQGLDMGTYRVVITNVECAVTSTAATLIPVSSGPVIPTSGQPTNWPSVISLGVNLTNRVGAIGNLVSYQWRLNGGPLPGQTKSTISLTNLQTANEGNYDVVVANMCGSVTSRVVTLTVDPTFVRINHGPGGTDAAGSIGAAWGDYDGDGYPDLFIANLTVGTSSAKNAFWHNNGDGTFTKITTGRPVLDQGAWCYPYWVDYDNDGDLDLHVLAANGLADKFYRNDGNGLFTPITPEFVKTTPYGFSNGELCGWSDFDNDGWLDVIIPRNNGNDLLFRGSPGGLFQSMTATRRGIRGQLLRLTKWGRFSTMTMTGGRICWFRP